MRANEILMAEHRNIERVLGALETAVDKLEAGEVVRPSFFGDATTFIREYADGCHHRKEEDVLFRAMVQAGMPKDGGPIGVMLAEHEQARAYTRTMREGAARWQEGDPSAQEAVCRAARAYAALLREHIMKEDEILFPLAAARISAGHQQSVSDEIATLDDAEERDGTHRRLLDLADALVAEVASPDQA